MINLCADWGHTSLMKAQIELQKARTEIVVHFMNTFM